MRHHQPKALVASGQGKGAASAPKKSSTPVAEEEQEQEQEAEQRYAVSIQPQPQQLQQHQQPRPRQYQGVGPYQLPLPLPSPQHHSVYVAKCIEIKSAGKSNNNDIFIINAIGKTKSRHDGDGDSNKCIIAKLLFVLLRVNTTIKLIDGENR